MFIRKFSSHSVASQRNAGGRGKVSSLSYTQEGTLPWLLFYWEEGAELKTPLPTHVPWEP